MWTKSGIIAFQTNVDGDLFALVSKAFLTAAIPLSLSILGYMFTISNKTKIVLSGILSEFNLSIISNKWLVSLFYRFLAVKYFKTKQTKKNVQCFIPCISGSCIKTCNDLHKIFWGSKQKCENENKNLNEFFIFVQDRDGKS